jgi:hypothetical protein
MMTDSRERFSKSLDSQFRHLGTDAEYRSVSGVVQTIRVIARRPEDIYELGEGRIHVENPIFDFRVSEVGETQTGDQICLFGQCYRIETEPQIDQHHLIWTAESLPSTG